MAFMERRQSPGSFSDLAQEDTQHGWMLGQGSLAHCSPEILRGAACCQQAGEQGRERCEGSPGTEKKAQTETGPPKEGSEPQRETEGTGRGG